MPGIALAPASEDNITVWHGNMTFLSGAYAGVNLHVLIECKDNYPLSAPDLYFRSEIPYTGGAASFKEGKGTFICLDILGNFAEIHTDQLAQSAQSRRERAKSCAARVQGAKARAVCKLVRKRRQRVVVADPELLQPR